MEHRIPHGAAAQSRSDEGFVGMGLWPVHGAAHQRHVSPVGTQVDGVVIGFPTPLRGLRDGRAPLHGRVPPSASPIPTKPTPLRGCARPTKRVSVAGRSAAQMVSCISIFRHDKHSPISRSDKFRAFRDFRCKMNSPRAQRAKIPIISIIVGEADPIAAYSVSSEQEETPRRDDQLGVLACGGRTRERSLDQNVEISQTKNSYFYVLSKIARNAGQSVRNS